jgi:hypothetical protein
MGLTFHRKMDLLAIFSKQRNFYDASKDVGLEINVEKTRYMLLSRHQNAD